MTHSDFPTYHAVVVGAGPAGVMAAIHASEAGDVLLVDSSALPRDKSCGGMLNEDSQAFLSEYGMMPKNLLVAPEWVHFRYHDWDRDVRKPTELRFANVDRRMFDEWLTSLLPAAVTLRGETLFSGFSASGDGVDVRLSSGTGDRTVRARYLIGCDGGRSSVRRALGGEAAPTYVTLQDFCRLEGDLEPYFDCFYMRDIGDSYGYGYVVPKGDVAIVGSVFYPKTKRPHEKHEQVLRVLRERLPLGESVKREPWVALSVRHPSDVLLGSDRVLLAGEAGGFMSPTSGEGISYALRTGRMAGEAVASTSREARASYEEATKGIRADIRRRLRWLPFMESETGKFLAGFVPTPIVSRVTKGL